MVGLPIDVDAIELPDMSVGRSRLAHPEWLRLARGCHDWGIVGFEVEGIPKERWINGIRAFFSSLLGKSHHLLVRFLYSAAWRGFCAGL